MINKCEMKISVNCFYCKAEHCKITNSYWVGSGYGDKKLKTCPKEAYEKIIKMLEPRI